MSLLWLLFLGLVVGAIGTVVGAGGGFLLVPALLLLYPSERPETITSISLAVVFFNALSGSIAYARMKRIDYKSGLSELAPGGKPLGDRELYLLKLEYAAWVAHLRWTDRLGRSVAVFGMYLAMAILCGFYIYHRRPKLLDDFRSFATLLAVVVLTVSLGRLFSNDHWRAEIIPLLLEKRADFFPQLAITLRRAQQNYGMELCKPFEILEQELELIFWIVDSGVVSPQN